MRLDPEERILLTEEQYQAMLKAIEEPAAPSEFLIAAFERYKKRVKESK